MSMVSVYGRGADLADIGIAQSAETATRCDSSALSSIKNKPRRKLTSDLLDVQTMLAEAQRLAQMQPRGTGIQALPAAQRRPQATGIQAFPAARALLNPAAHLAVPGMQHRFAGNMGVPLQHLVAGIVDAGLQGMPSGLPGVRQINIREVWQGDKLGEGGFGTVCCAATQRHNNLALKLLTSTATAAHHTALLREIILLASLHHPFVVEFHCAVVEPGYPACVIGHLTERAQFGSLPQFLGWYKLSALELIVISLRLAEGLGYIHLMGVLHLDLKPDNVLIAVDDVLGVVPKIADYGLSAPGYVEGGHLNVGGFRGTRLFASPEMQAIARGVPHCCV
jgi:hypothetical protein